MQLAPGSGILVCGHGSRAAIAAEEFALLVRKLRAKYDIPVEYGFLEYSAPNIHTAIDKLRAAGVKQVYAIPGMLFAATHTQNDIPAVLTSYMQKQPDIAISYGRHLGLQESMIKAFEQTILATLVLQDIPKPGDLYDTMLVVVGRGTSVAEANADVAKLTRIVAERFGFAWSETVYSGVTFPSVGCGLSMAIKLGFSKIIVAPYFLFGGRLIDRISHYTEQVAAANPAIDIKLAHYLRDQNYVVDAFCARIDELLRGRKCGLHFLTEFQRKLAAGKAHLHHHHAEYQAGAEHADGHHHHEYLHSQHPLGPITMASDLNRLK